MCEKDKINKSEIYCKICGIKYIYSSHCNHKKSKKHNQQQNLTFGVINLYKGRLDDLRKLIDKYEELQKEE